MQGCQKQTIALTSYYDRPVVSFHFDKSFLVNTVWINLLQKSLHQVFYARGYSINHAENAVYTVYCTDFLVSTIIGLPVNHDLINGGKFQKIDCRLSIKKGKQLLLEDYLCTYEQGMIGARDFLWKNRYEHDTMKEICSMLASQIEAICFKYM